MILLRESGRLEMKIDLSMIIDNKQDRDPNDGINTTTVWDYMKYYTDPEKNREGVLDIVTGFFSVTGLELLGKHFSPNNEYRMVLAQMVADDQFQDHILDLLNDDCGIVNALQLSDAAKNALEFLRRDKVHVKAIINAFCHAKLYLFKDNHDPAHNYYVQGSSNLTYAGLGYTPSSNVELNLADTGNSDTYRSLRSWFEEQWTSVAKEKMPEDREKPKGAQIDVKQYFIQEIEKIFRKYTPEEIYYKILFELFNSDLDLDGGIEHRQDMQLLQTSVIWNTLFNYQQKGVISLIKMLRKYNGAILADAVGLGKTFSALAVIKYFQTQNYLTVLLCPKKLEQNWDQYLRRRNSRFEKDEFDYIVRFHTDMQNDRMEERYTDAKLSYLQTRKKILVVIDESHNLRNEKSGRYQELMAKLIQNKEGQENRDVKVLMLSATPINTGLNDVKGQFNLIGHGKDDAFDNDDFGVESLTNLFKDAQTKYTQWCNNPDRTIGGFIATLPPKFFNLTDKLIVARTRKLIEKTLGEDLGFPDKEKPVNIYQGVEHLGKLQTTEEIYQKFDELSLTAYQPSLYLEVNKKKARKGAAKDWDDNVNRERFLVKMMGVLFMKRLESSWYSCMTTVKKVLDVHESTLKLALEFKEKGGNGAISTGGGEGNADFDDEEIDDLMDEAYSLRKGTIKLSDMQNLGGFIRNLQMDVNKLKEIYKNFEAFAADYEAGEEKDLKLEELVRILNEKKKAKNKKVVIFTAFADTAQFIFDELKKRGFSRMASASGQNVFTTGAHSTKNFTAVLESFAPYSKLYKEKDWSGMYADAQLDRAKYYDDEKQRWNVSYEKWLELIAQYDTKTLEQVNDGIDILIATDCLSEGQNLQDADTQVNFDIHWNPVRLIQRFGRIDRIGSPNKVIRCVNFWPAKSFEDYLHLETRIQNRMSLMKLVDTETQELDEKFKKMVEDNPLQDKNADRLLEELQNNSISDIESPKTLSLKDFSFETYRQDLLDFLDKNRDVFRRMPNGIFSGFRFDDTLFEKIPESLVAVVGYPHRKQGSNKPYTELYLMCQPVDIHLPATYQELNRAEILEFLRTNKNQERYVPDWIENNDNERISKLSGILKEWMKSKVPQQATSIILDIAKSHKAGGLFANPKKKDAKSKLLEEKFKIENFDLIVWEYVSKK